MIFFSRRVWPSDLPDKKGFIDKVNQVLFSIILELPIQQELRAHMALVTRPEGPRAKSSYGMSSNKIIRINRLV